MFSKFFVQSFGSPLHDQAAASFPPFARIVLLKSLWLSTSIAANDSLTGCPQNTCPISDLLLNECGFRQSELSRIFKIKPNLVRVRSTLTAQQAVRYLRDSGFTDDRVRTFIIRNPSFITLNADRLLKSKFECMKTWGLTAQDILVVLYRAPRLINCSLEKLLCPNMQYLQNLFGPEADVSRVFKSPQFLVSSNMPQLLEKKMKHWATFGLLEDEIKELFRSHPKILNISMVKVQKNMEFLMNTAGLPAKFVLKQPNLVSCYSLERRIKPRHKVWSAVCAMQPSKRPRSLISALNLSERTFLEKYVHSNPHATELYEIYSGKPAVL